MIEYRLVRSKRRTLSIHITRDATVEVRAPLRLPKWRIEEFLLQKQCWVEQHHAQALARLAQRADFSPTCLLLLGKEYPIVPTEGKPLFDGARFLLPGKDWDAWRPAAINLYRELARRDLDARLLHWIKETGISPAGWSVTAAARRWGSCSGKNKLCFSWRLILAHPDAVDYVVVHELAHIRHHNHSPAFWAEVCGFLPDYPRRQALLRALQERLASEPWADPG